MAKGCSCNHTPDYHTLVRHHHRSCRAFSPELLNNEKHQIQWPQCFLAERPEPEASLPISDYLRSKPDHVHDFIDILDHSTQLPNVHVSRIRLPPRRRRDPGDMDYRRRASVSI